MNRQNSDGPVIGVSTASEPNVDINLHKVVRLERGQDGLTVFHLEGVRHVQSTIEWKHLMERLYEGMQGFAWEPRPRRGMFDHR